jgi:nitronate monooxygenase
MHAFLETFCRENEISNAKSLSFNSNEGYREQIEVIIQEKVTVMSFTFGIPDDQSLIRLKKHRVKLVGTATSVEEAKLLEEKGVDVIIAQGLEAGGHRGSFLHDPLPLVGCMSLIPAIADSVKIPILAAGGIADSRSFRAAMALGASGILVGSAFLLASESAASDVVRKKIKEVSETGTVLTRAFTGKWARAVKNDFITGIESSGLDIPEFHEQLALTLSIRSFAAEHQRDDLLPIWAGQSAGLASEDDVVAIMMSILQ